MNRWIRRGLWAACSLGALVGVVAVTGLVLADRTMNRRIEVDGQRVPAVLRPDPAAGSPTRIEIATARVERANASERGDLATDFTARGHVLRSADSLVETVVDIAVIAPTRTARSLVIDALLREIVERPSLIVGHLPATTSVERPAQADIDLGRYDLDRLFRAGDTLFVSDRT